MEDKIRKHIYSLFTIHYSLFLALLFALILPSCQSGKEAAQPPVQLEPGVSSLADEVLADLEEPVLLRIYRGGPGEIDGRETQALVDLIGTMSPKITVEKMDISSASPTPDLAVPRGPVIEMKGSAPGVLRYYGYPERKEVKPFLEGILEASGYRTSLAPDVTSFISGLQKEVLIRIFTTPD